MSTIFWQRWLIVVTGGVIIYGFVLIFFSQPIHALFNALFFESSEIIEQFGEEGGDFLTLVYGVLGAVIIGWMTALLSILIIFFPHDQRRAWMTITLSVVMWFIIDSGFSLMIGSVSHALFNTAFLILFVIPLVAIYRQF